MSGEFCGPYKWNTVHQADCIEAMRQLPDQCIDLAIADPPYNASKGGTWKWDNSVPLPGFGGDWSKVMANWDDIPLADYFAFTVAWLAELQRLVRPTGSIWIHGTYHNIGVINFALQALQIEIINEVVWFKRNSFPNLSGRRLTASHETILWAHTGRRRQYWFDYQAAKSIECPEDALKAAGKQMRTVWDVPNNKSRAEIRYGKHPTQKPLRLLARMLELSAKPGQCCLAPFAGAGSECIAAREAGLRFLGFEKEADYVHICGQRLGQSAQSPTTPAAVTSCRTTESPGEPPTAHETFCVPRCNVSSIPSLIKWTGSKRSQAKRIAKEVPPYRRYFEPFLGSGALLYLTAGPTAVAGDAYEPLIRLWKLVRRQPHRVTRDYATKWQQLRQQGPDYFYDVREQFNRKQSPLDLCFLLRTCVNGIVRFNERGEFNNSFHLSRPGMAPARFEAVVVAWHAAIKDVEFVCQDYADTLADAGAEDFVYLDPPYAGNNQRYADRLDLDQFFGNLDELNRKGVRWALSFDGRRGETDFTHPVPTSLYRRRLLFASGNSPVGKVLNGPVEQVAESLYLNY